MLLIETYVGPSSIHGIGLYSNVTVQAGTPIWEYNPITTQIFWKKQFINICKSLSLPAIIEFLDHSYIKNDNIYYLTDRTKYINHSLDPNIEFNGKNLEIALRTIHKGEEITENYSNSYDENDFFFWNIDRDNINKEMLISALKYRLLGQNNNPIAS